MIVYECSEEDCNNFVFNNPGIGCGEHGLTMEEKEV